MGFVEFVDFVHGVLEAGEELGATSLHLLDLFVEGYVVSGGRRGDGGWGLRGEKGGAFLEFELLDAHSEGCHFLGEGEATGGKVL